MTTDLIERLEQPEYTGENRCGACTAVNLLLAAGLAALLGRRNRALGLLAFLGGAALIYLRGYLVPGTPKLTKKYLPEPVLALFGKDERPASLDAALTRHAADRTADDAVAVEVDEAGGGADRETDTEAGDGSASATDAEADAGTEVEPEADVGTDAASADVTREDVQDLLARPMDEVLEDFAVVEADEDADDLVLVDDFRLAWEETIDALADDPEARRGAFADVVGVPVADVHIEQRQDGRFYALVENTATHNWITEAAMLSDLAAHRALDDPRWDVLDPEERLSVLRGFRVFLTTCPECGGPVSATDDVVESCCGAWDVVAVECGDCGARVLELEAPGDAGSAGNEPDPAGPTGGFTR